MDLLTQIQISIASLPQEVHDSIAALSNTPLSVQEAHALSQLSQIGFVGIQSITNPYTPVGLNGELVPFLETSSNSIKLAQNLYTKIRMIDSYLQRIPPDGNRVVDADGNTKVGNYYDELEKAVEEYNDSVQELYEMEEKSKDIRQKIQTIINYGTDLVSKPLNNGDGIYVSDIMPSANELMIVDSINDESDDFDTNSDNTIKNGGSSNEDQVQNGNSLPKATNTNPNNTEEEIELNFDE